MARKRTGTITTTRDGRLQIVVTFRGKRVRLPPLPRGTSTALARDRAAYWAAEAERRERVGLELDGSAVKTEAKAPPVPATAVHIGSKETATWYAEWLADRRKRGYSMVRHNHAHVRRYVVPVVADKHPRDWTTDDMRAVVRLLDERVSSGVITAKTALNAWTTVKAVCKAACASKSDVLRCRKDNPSANVQGPERGDAKEKTFLYPSELLHLLACDDVPLSWRRYLTVAVYTAMRAGELRVLEWGDVDLDHGRIHVHRAYDHDDGGTKSTKTGRARNIVIEPALLPLLAAMHQEADGRGLVLDLPDGRNLAVSMRRYLKRAEVDRADLHTDDETRKAITFHDCRTTGLTWMAARGDSPWSIKQHAGHTSLSTTEGYVKLGEQLRSGFGEPFPDLPVSLLGGGQSFAESFALAARSKKRRGYGALQCEGGDSNPHGVTH